MAAESSTHARTRDLSDVSPTLLDELEAFFGQYNRLEGKAFRVVHRRGAPAAAALAERSRAEAA